MNFLRILRNLLVRALLAPPPLRRWIAWEIRGRHFAELNVVIPLTRRISCPVSHAEAWSSFFEVFVTQEYAPVFERIPLPGRWLDLGSYAGFFTAYVLMMRDRAGLRKEDAEALLVDADSRSGPAAERLALVNGVAGRVRFRRGVIAGDSSERVFVERPFMASSLDGYNPEPGRVQRVPVLAAAEILAELSPPYDLLKLDVEGAEVEFFQAYASVLAAARHLVVEWHHWEGGGVDAAGTARMLAAHGFRQTAEIVPSHKPCGGETTSTCGLLLFENTALVRNTPGLE